ncbi:hypothetical protein VTK73DRAFT_10147 [Phialemonium thermophilum]|uniref:Rhodopsin domain-containing protein n=1 Tax=Phialemonium thermophilum TaxID=223376 RepID=A0ABR3XI37_9PEZI
MSEPSSAPPDPAAAAAQAAAAAAFKEFSIEAWTLLSIGLLVTILRTYTRVRAVGFKGLQADDLLAWIGALFYCVETSLAYSVGNVAHGLANNGMTDKQRASLSPKDPEYRLRVIGSKIQLAGWSSYSALLWSLKLSLLVFYMRLTAGLSRSYRIRIYIGFAFLVASWIIVVMNLFLACRPFHKYWQIFPDPGNVCQPAVSNQVVWVYLAFNVATDLYLLSIPLPMLWQSSLKPIKKVGLMVVFSGGIFVVVCAILRCILIVTDPVNGAQLAGSWAVRETFVAVVTTNLPIVFSLIKTMLEPIFGSLFSSVRSTKPYDRTPREIRTFGGGHSGGAGTGAQRSGRGRGPPTVNPLTNITFSESEERIVDELKMQDIKTTWSESGSDRGPVSSSQEHQEAPPRTSHTYRRGGGGSRDGGTDGSDKHNGGGGVNIRKQVEVAVVHEHRPFDAANGLGAAEAGAVRNHGHYAFARGPKRSSYHAQVHT